jgi:predicted amidohydrolase YtcJ
MTANASGKPDAGARHQAESKLYRYENRGRVHFAGSSAPASCIPQSWKGGQAPAPRSIVDAEALTMDTLIRARAIHAMTEDRAVQRALGIVGGRIVAVGREPHDLDAQATAQTRIVDATELTLVPALYDTHCHLMELLRNIALLDLSPARTVAELVALIGAAAAGAPPGAWIQSSNAWHERDLAEERLPTLRELDAVSGEHPVLCRRGGHVAVANARALALAGIDAHTPAPPGGLIGHDKSGALDGMLEGAAVYQVAAKAPPLPFDAQVDQLARATQLLAATGLGAVRDPMVRGNDTELYRAAHARGLLHTRCRLMLGMSPARSLDGAVAQLERWSHHGIAGDDWLRVWGLKLVMDGGIEGGALDQPYANDPSYSGHLNWEPELFAQTVVAAVTRGWRVGTHAVGDRAVRVVLDAYERAAAARPGLPPGTLTLEHAFLADKTQRARAVRLGVHVTVQAPLLYALAAQSLVFWGPERTRAILPVRDWLADGATLSAGTDYPIASFAPLASIWGFVTRQTRRSGVQGPEQAIDARTALALYTVGGAQLDGELDTRGTLAPGRLADFAAFTVDPLSCATDELRTLAPALVVVGGRAQHDRDGRWR